MNKAEAIADLNSRILKVLNEYAPNNINGGDKEYSFLCRVKDGNNIYEDNYSIVVVNEGLNTEVAGYANGKEPPVLKTDLEIGLGLLLAEDPGAKVLGHVSDKLFKVQYSDNSIAIITLNKNKDGLLKASSV